MISFLITLEGTEDQEGQRDQERKQGQKTKTCSTAREGSKAKKGHRGQQGHGGQEGEAHTVAEIKKGYADWYERQTPKSAPPIRVVQSRFSVLDPDQEDDANHSKWESCFVQGKWRRVKDFDVQDRPKIDLT